MRHVDDDDDPYHALAIDMYSTFDRSRLARKVYTNSQEY